ncbi:response regulator transcription factor [Dyadobacter chenwenxiniae]|uniref:Response regulator transcription factor n=1 Tax=Dyadobacter chenwenxiniae TaxID=2906456 RepID=A0A9X1PLR3_9BACT|nr:response regulator transcription factor [Dyadobacter chenwenxiniae]MCF0063632.1 response regulator transcription factor [Dyadobacter chenwenxiniae]UON83308.1 response regulator transcription factor [Dyadobacter chenwenxiniae]
MEIKLKHSDERSNFVLGGLKNSSIKVVLVDELVILTDALRCVLQGMQEIGNVASYTDGKVFLADKSACPPGILIMDWAINGMSGLELLDFARNAMPKEMKIIILSTVTDVQTIKHAIRRGANGFLPKTTSLDELKEAIVQVIAGKQYIGKGIRDNLINSVFTDEQVVLHLSPREKEVLQKVCSGRTIKEIAYDLKLSAHTVQYYHRSVMDKLKVKRTTDLIVYAMQHGLYIPELKEPTRSQRAG